MPLNLRPDTSILLYGESGHGKSTLGAELAKEVYKESKKVTHVFMADEGSHSPYEILEELGVVHIHRPSGNPWIWVNRAFQGQVRDGAGWKVVADTVSGDNTVGLIIHEGITAYAELLMQEMSRMSAEGLNVGGDGVAQLGKDREKDEKNVLKAWKIEVKGDKEVMRVGGNSQAHFGIAQTQIREGLLAGRPKVPHLYTAMTRRGESGSNSPVLGPLVIGEALTGKLPRWFDYTFRVVADSQGQHTLYLGPHSDPSLGGRTIALANPRLPKEGAKVKVQLSITPASIVQALSQMRARKDAARDEVRAELGL